MPATLATWVAKTITVAAINAGASGIVSATIYNVAYAAAYVGVTAGASYAVSALTMDTPDASQAQGTLKQSIPPRIRAYGRGRLPVSLMLWEAKENYAYDVGAIHHGRVISIDEVWSHDEKLTINGSGWVVGNPAYGGGNSDLIHIESRLGLPTETAYSSIVAALSGTGTWTNDHRGDGIASIGCDYHHAKQENLPDDFPHGAPNWSVVGEWSPIWDPRDEAQDRDDDSNHEASSNTGLQILDLLTSPEGFNEDYETTIAPVLEHWKGEFDICDESIAQKGGGFAPRYASFDYYALSDDPQECLNRLLAACDGRLLMDENGCWKLWVGKYREPTVWLTEADILDYDVAGDAAVEDVVNELVPSFKSEAQKWNIVESTPWRVSSDVSMRGRVETTPFQLPAVNNNSQAQRLMKREASRLLAQLRGVLNGKLSAARAMGERWVGVTFPELGFDETVIEIEDGGKVSFSGMVTVLPFVLADENADAWNAASEEGDGPAEVDRLTREALVAPDITTVTAFFEDAGSGTGVRLNVVGTGPDREDLIWYVRWRVDGATSWVEGQFADADASGGVELDTGFVPANETLEVQIAYETGGGTLSPWGPATPETVDTSTAALPPAMPTGLSAVDNGTTPDGATVQWNNGANVTDAVVYIGGPADDFEDATGDSGDLAATPGTTQAHNYLASAGSYRIWVTNKNAAGESDPAGPVAVTVV